MKKIMIQRQDSIVYQPFKDIDSGKDPFAESILFEKEQCQVCKSPVLPYRLQEGQKYCGDCGSMYMKVINGNNNPDSPVSISFKWCKPQVLTTPEIIIPRTKHPGFEVEIEDNEDVKLEEDKDE